MLPSNKKEDYFTRKLSFLQSFVKNRMPPDQEKIKDYILEEIETFYRSTIR
ncbi:hypothetical protein M0R19_05085 [Candidatus Pacearchaeota archaeon]|jgi:hypothetical protein|nr:hypothetical protein [Candidatus Pacearchaeota archaeon]